MKTIYRKKNLRILFLTSIIVILLIHLLKLVSHGSQIPKLLIIDSQRGEPYKTIRKNTIARLRNYGYNNGYTIIIKYYSLENRLNAAKIIWEIEKNNYYDVIFVNGSIAAIGFKPYIIKDLTKKYIFGAVTDPVGIGLIKDFHIPPRYNITGVSYPVKVEERLRFIKMVMPNAKRIGLVYAEMPQSISYLKWIKKALKTKEFSSLKILTRKVQLVKGEYGYKRMIKLAEGHIHELNEKVDLFMSPNDQMGAQGQFAQMVYKNSTKPLLGLNKNDVMKNMGATMAIYPDLELIGYDIAKMIKQVIKGKKIKTIYPKISKKGIAFDLKKIKQFKIKLKPSLLSTAGKNIVK